MSESSKGLLAAIRLLQDRDRVEWGWNPEREQYEYFLDGQPVGINWLAVIEAESRPATDKEE
jgi:hypothetical protein